MKLIKLIQRIAGLRRRPLRVLASLAAVFTGLLLIALMGGGVIALFNDYPLRYKAATVFVLIFLPQIFWSWATTFRKH